MCYIKRIRHVSLTQINVKLWFYRIYVRLFSFWFSEIFSVNLNLTWLSFVNFLLIACLLSLFPCSCAPIPFALCPSTNSFGTIISANVSSADFPPSWTSSFFASVEFTLDDVVSKSDNLSIDWNVTSAILITDHTCLASNGSDVLALLPSKYLHTVAPFCTASLFCPLAAGSHYLQSPEYDMSTLNMAPILTLIGSFCPSTHMALIDVFARFSILDTNEQVVYCLETVIPLNLILTPTSSSS